MQTALNQNHQRVSDHSIMGVPIHLMDDYPGWLLARLAQGRGSHVITLNSEMVMQAKSTPELATVIHQADLIVPDGAGVVLYFKLYGKSVARYPGIELAEKLLQAAAIAKPALSVYFYGGAPDVTTVAAHQWQKQLPDLNLVGVRHGYQSPEEQEEMLTELVDLQPKIIFVGLGVPRQEYWIARHRHLCPQSIWVGVGGSFDVWAGKKNRAPQWLRDNHLEWVYRLYQEPWRWRRMLALPQFACLALLERITG